MEFFNVVSIKEGRTIMSDNFKKYEFSTEYVSIEDCLNRILA